MKIKFLLFLLLFTLTISAQDKVKIDSLKVKLDNSYNDTTKIDLLIRIADIYTKSNFGEAINYSQQALEISKKTNNKRYLSKSYRNLANSMLFYGNYNESLNNYLKSLKIAEEINDDIEKFQTYHNIGVLKDRLHQFDEALVYYFKALGLFEKNIEKGKLKNYLKQYSVIYNSIGNIYSSKGDFETAKEYYLKGYKLAVEYNNYNSLGVITNNLGKQQLEHKNYDAAIKYLNESLEVRKKDNDVYGIAKTYVFIAWYYKDINQLDKAIESAEKAYQLSLETKAIQTSIDAIQLLTEIYEKKGDYKQSLILFKEFKTMNDSLINDKKFNELTRLQLKYDYEIENKERVVKEQRIKYKLIIVSSTLLLSLIIISLLFFLSRNRNKRIRLEKEKLEKDMMIKNKELTTNVMYLLKKNELIDNITHRLLNLKSKLSDDNREPIQKIIFDLQSLTEKEVWEEFEYRFQSVHEDFYKNLQTKFPDLSPSEIKLAAFLRLNMTTKDIASITGQNINSIETARYRLRKKLGITNQEVNLVNFLLNI